MQRNLLILLHNNEFCAQLNYTDLRKCWYLNVYLWMGGQNTFCALHRDTLASRAGNLVLSGSKEWTFVFSENLERLHQVLGGESRLYQDLSVPDMGWLRAQDGISVVTKTLQPGQLMIVNRK